MMNIICHKYREKQKEKFDMYENIYYDSIRTKLLTHIH